MSKMRDKERAELLGLTLDGFYAAVPDLDPEDHFQEYLAKAEESAQANKGREELEEMMPLTRGLPHTTKVYDALHIELHWPKAPETEEEKHLFEGYHIHSKDNPYGLHTHIPGGKLGGGHKHGPQTRLGEHTHVVDIQDLASTGLAGGKTGRGPIEVDGSHEHCDLHPDGGHRHSPQTFG